MNEERERSRREAGERARLALVGSATLPADESGLREAIERFGAAAAAAAARAAARNRARAIREVACDLERCARTIDRVQLTGAEKLRAEAARYARVADNVEASLRTR